MKQILSTRQIVGTFAGRDEELEVCATGEAQFDESQGKLMLELDSFARPIDNRHVEEHRRCPWLPKKQQVSEPITPGEASDLARDIFHRWSVTVRRSVPVA